MGDYRTSDIARAVGVHPSTVRLYERWGFLPPIPRAPNGYRQYSPLHLEQMRLALMAMRITWPGGAIRKAALAVLHRSAAGQSSNQALHATLMMPRKDHDQIKLLVAPITVLGLLLAQNIAGLAYRRCCFSIAPLSQQQVDLAEELPKLLLWLYTHDAPPIIKPGQGPRAPADIHQRALPNRSPSGQRQTWRSGSVIHIIAPVGW